MSNLINPNDFGYAQGNGQIPANLTVNTGPAQSAIQILAQKWKDNIMKMRVQMLSAVGWYRILTRSAWSILRMIKNTAFAQVSMGLLSRASTIMSIYSTQRRALRYLWESRIAFAAGDIPLSITLKGYARWLTFQALSMTSELAASEIQLAQARRVSSEVEDIYAYSNEV